ncbi:MAG TPA: hypothetical protein VG675_20895 [Bryobacteraceae bacterium]|nr:hypothetical protein [Bryobacteraceae bacterium]
MEDRTALGTAKTLEWRGGKYGVLWVWSILSLIVVYLSYSFGETFLFQGGGTRFRADNLLTVEQTIGFVTSVLVLIALLAAMFCLYRLLSQCILPAFFEDKDLSELRPSAPILRRAFAALLAGAALQVAGCITGYLLKLLT